MEMISKIVRKGIFHKDYPVFCPQITLSKKDQVELLKGKFLLRRDTKYGEDFIVRIKEKSLGKSSFILSDIILDPSRKMDNNPIWREELNQFYQKHPQFSP